MISSIKFQEIYSQNYDKLSDEDKKFLHETFLNPKTTKELKEKLQQIIFIKIPPTPEEFLDSKNKWLPETYVSGLYSYIKKDFVKAMNTKKPYSIISIYGSTRTGKSLLARLFTMYSIIYVCYLRDPHAYFKINPMSKLCAYLLSFVSSKTAQVYISPLINLLDASEMFVRERFEQKTYEHGVDEEGKIHWSESSKFGDITFPKISVVSGRDASSLVGADIVCGAVSELTFFKNYSSLDDSEIVQVFTKLFTRIQNTVGFSVFPCWSYIDSSSNDSSSEIEKMILYDLKEKDTVFFRHYVLWEVRPHLYPKWNKDRSKTFKICIGNNNVPACVINEQVNIKDIPSELIIDVPIDLKDTFERNLIDSIKDIAGRPTGNENKLIQNIQTIENIFDNSALINIEHILKVDAADKPEGALWQHIDTKYFTRYDMTQRILRRASQEPRYIGLDLAHSVKGDVMGICMLHKEWSRETKQIMFIADFCFAVGGVDTGINLEAPTYFIMDLANIGNTPIQGIFVDQFQSQTLIQYLVRNRIKAVKQSVDTTLEPYLFFVNCMMNKAFKSGKNIFLKNNLLSLVRIKMESGKEKVDHIQGKSNNLYNGDFEHSTAGLYAKDVSDAVCQALYGAYLDAEYIPVTVYEDENMKLSTKPEDITPFISAGYGLLHKFY